MMELSKISLLLNVLFGSIDWILANEDPCSFHGNYESFIKGIPEDTPVGSVIGSLDFVGGENEIILQQIPNNYLQLDIPSRNITLQSQLDTDTHSNTLSLLTKCATNEEPSLTVTVTVRVLLQDVNDHPPKFSKAQYSVDLSEATEIGTVIFRDAVAEDKDLSGAGNDIFLYSIVSGPFSDYFEYKYSLYPDITLKKKLDFEQTRLVQIELMAKDSPNQGSSLNSTATLLINIKDADDLNPKFQHDHYYGTVSGNSLPGTVVAVLPDKVTAFDQDTINAAVKYELQDPRGTFLIHNSTGVVTVNSALGSEPPRTLVLKAIQVDNPFRWCIATLDINITGITPSPSKNDTLRFQFSKYQVSLSESTPVGTVVKSLRPLGSYQTDMLVYTVMESQDTLSITPSGDIVLNKLLDYEQQQNHIITVTVTNGQDTSITTVNISVTDVNDNSPELENTIISLSAERVKGTVLTIIKVSDLDKHSHFTFQLLTHTNLFAVNSIGEISIIGSEEDLTLDKYELTITVKDGVDPIRESVALVIVNFPASSIRPVSGARIMSESSDVLAIAFGVAAACLFLVVIFLIVYIIRRRLYAAEQLDKVKHQRGMNPRGLTYRAGDSSPVPSNFDLKFNGELEETSEIDGSTSIQENPLSDSRFRFGYPNLNGDVDLDAGDEEIHIDTAVVPFEREDYFRNSGRMKTFGHEECNSSDNSYASDSTGDSNKGLMRKLKKQALANGTEKIGNTNRLPSYMSDSVLDSRLGQKPTKEKPEITVYF